MKNEKLKIINCQLSILVDGMDVMDVMDRIDN